MCNPITGTPPPVVTRYPYPALAHVQVLSTSAMNMLMCPICTAVLQQPIQLPCHMCVCESSALLTGSESQHIISAPVVMTWPVYRTVQSNYLQTWQTHFLGMSWCAVHCVGKVSELVTMVHMSVVSSANCSYK